jgi:hypothetical protein
MKKVELQNFSLRGIWNAMLMRKEDNLKLKIFNKRLHHGYIGLLVLLGSFTTPILYLSWLGLGTGISFIVHDIISEFI